MPVLKATNTMVIFEELLTTLVAYSQASPAEFVGAAAPLVLGAPYLRKEAISQQERLCIGVAGFDCVTLVETILALRIALQAKSKTDVEAFSKALVTVRYRRGGIDDYQARLHYFSAWLRENGKNNVIVDITKLLGGKKRKKTINWMSRHQEDYPPLADPAQLAGILEVEGRLSRSDFFYIPKEAVADIERYLQQGDIIAFTSSMMGLDVAHCGFVLNTPRLLHASSVTGNVELSAVTIAIYAQQRSDVDGIIVARMV